MITINNAYLYRFKKKGSEYLFYICNGVYLGFNSNKEYIGVETIYNISTEKYVLLENKALNTLYRLGFIYDK